MHPVTGSREDALLVKVAAAMLKSISEKSQIWINIARTLTPIYPLPDPGLTGSIVASETYCTHKITTLNTEVFYCSSMPFSSRPDHFQD